MGQEHNSIGNISAFKRHSRFAVLSLCLSVPLLAVALTAWNLPARASDRYQSLTGKDCTACHADLNNIYRLTTYGAIFKANGCPVDGVKHC